MIIVLLQQIQIRTGQWKHRQCEFVGSGEGEFQMLSSHVLKTRLLPSTSVCHYQPGRRTWALVPRVFIGVSSHRHNRPNHWLYHETQSLDALLALDFRRAGHYHMAQSPNPLIIQLIFLAWLAPILKYLGAQYLFRVLAWTQVWLKGPTTNSKGHPITWEILRAWSLLSRNQEQRTQKFFIREQMDQSKKYRFLAALSFSSVPWKATLGDHPKSPRIMSCFLPNC